MKKKAPVVELTGTAIDDVRGGALGTIQFTNPNDRRILGGDDPTSDTSGYSHRLRYTGGYTTTQ